MSSGDITRYVVTVNIHEASLTELNELNNAFTRANFLLTLTDDEGKDIELEYIDALEYNGTTYMAFFPVVEEDSEEEENEEEYGLIILKSQMENGEEFLVTIEDEEEIDKVYDLFMEQILADEE